MYIIPWIECKKAKKEKVAWVQEGKKDSSVSAKVKREKVVWVQEAKKER